MIKNYMGATKFNTSHTHTNHKVFMKLRHKLLLAFLAIALVPTLIIGGIASFISSSAIEEQAFNQLVSVREIKKSEIESYFSEKHNDIDVLTKTIQKFLDFSSVDSVNASVHDNHAYFDDFIKAYGYYDFFLIDESGEIFYTVTKEADYQTSVMTGAYKDTGLAKLYRQVKESNSYGMSDFSPYAPSNNIPAGFIALPFTSKEGTSMVVALQLSIEKINEIMQQRAGMGKTGESYLIGSDLRMRSDSFLDPKGRSILASFKGNIKNNGVDTEGAKLAISGKTGKKIITDYNGNQVLSVFTPLDINGIRWGLLSEIDVAEAFEPVYMLYWDILVIILIFVVLVVLIASFITKSIITPLGGEPEEMQRISDTIANGDLTVQFENGREKNSVYGAMNKMAVHLLAVMSQIVDSSNSLASAAEETSALSLQSSVSLQKQQSSIEQVATAVEEMSASINEVAKNATDVATAAQTAQSSSTEANGKLTQTINDLNKLDNEISKASDVIKDLEKDSYEIGSVLEVIRGIADQTNLLALNAAIEAARAGEQGRGFAVVADEVRNLASKTQESTQNIETMISKLQGASKDAVNVMTTSRDVCKHTINNAHTTAEVINVVDTEINSITEMTEIIATAVEEQSCVSGEISQNITAINDVAYENSTASTQVATAGEEISKIAATLNELTTQFKV